jgi:hypothetical protein
MAPIHWYLYQQQVNAPVQRTVNLTVLESMSALRFQVKKNKKKFIEFQEYKFPLFQFLKNIIDV